MKTFLVVTLVAFTARAAAESKKGPYEVKSGTIEMTNSMLEGMKTTIYFDDYGARRATLTVAHTTVMGKPVNSERWQIVADGAITNYDAVKKTGTRRKLAGDRIPPPAGMPMPDPKTMSEEAKKNMKALGEKQVAGKTCKGMETSMMGMSIRAWMWKGIPLYTEMTGSGPSARDPKAASAKPIVMQATSVKEGDVPASRFTVPADVVIKDF